jgi:hypothetical protein
MDKSKSIAGIAGPTLLVMVLSELKIWNPTLYDEQIVPLVYLSGVLLFVAGIAIVRMHNLWVLRWPVAITIAGWLGMTLGAFRAFFPQTYRDNFNNDTPTLLVELVLIGLGLFLTFKAYWRR